MVGDVMSGQISRLFFCFYIISSFIMPAFVKGAGRAHEIDDWKPFLASLGSKIRGRLL